MDVCFCFHRVTVGGKLIYPRASETEHQFQCAVRIGKELDHFVEPVAKWVKRECYKQLYEKNELTNAINRIVEDINHRFTLEVLTRDFKSSDLSISAKNLRKDRENPNDILDHIDIAKVNETLKSLLEIRDKSEQSVELQDEKFRDLSLVERKRVTERIIAEIKGRMMEDIVLLETKLSRKNCEVFKLQFAVGEFDMVVFDMEKGSCEIYEIKPSMEVVPQQCRHLLDEPKCRDTEFRYGKITGKYVIYRGEKTELEDVTYLNVEEYLKNL